MNTRQIATIMLMGIMVMFVPGHSSAENNKSTKMDLYDELASPQERADNTSFIWFNDRNMPPELLATNINKFNAALDAREIGYRNIIVGDANGLFVYSNEEKLRDLITEVDSALAELITIEPNAIMYGFDSECTDTTRNYTPERTEWGVSRVWGGLTPTPFIDASGKAAWVIDSGISDEFTAELNLISRLNCNTINCPPDLKKDRVGHGTMIAGIIGAQTGNSEGVTGVAPGVPLHSMRVVKKRGAITNLDAVVWALKYLKDNFRNDMLPTTPSAGDVVNISLGSVWAAQTGNTQTNIETEIRKLADLGFMISIAAGNTDVLKNIGYVQSISPARIGGYTASSGGVVMTASATNNRDEFWEFSAFGNYLTRPKPVDPRRPDEELHEQVQSLPDFAEPGVAIISLWPGKEVAECSGTSFAAAHLSGILLYGIPRIGARAQFDTSAEKIGIWPRRPPDAADYENSLLDPIGLKP